MKFELTRALNTKATSDPGWCLYMAQEVTGTPHLYATAWEAWLATKKKHSTKDPIPDGAIVWFSHTATYNGIKKNWGHVVVKVNNRYLSSPAFSSDGGRKWLNSIKEVETVFNSTYVGWSEDISGERVIQPKKEEDMITYLQLYDLTWRILGRAPTAAAIKKYVGKLTYEEVRKRIFNSAEYKKLVARAKNDTTGKYITRHLHETLRKIYEKRKPTDAEKKLDKIKEILK